MALRLPKIASTAVERQRLRAWLATLRSDPAVATIGAQAPAARVTPVPPAIIEMFGRFEMSIGGCPISWVRRRDREVIAFLATRPGARATRAEVIAAFWPEADRQLAGQSLRTACSTIRRAIGVCVGRANVGRYFVADAELALVLENTFVSSREFARRYELAASAYDRGDYAGSAVYSRSAEMLYRSPFLAGEPQAFWALALGQNFASMHVKVIGRLEELRIRQAAEGQPASGALQRARDPLVHPG